MKKQHRGLVASVAGAFLAMPSIVFAGSAAPMVVVGPVATAGAGATAVPTMSASLMIALGLLLAVVALRFLRQKGVAQKMLSLVVLGSGVAIGGLGVQETRATSVTVSVESSACSGATESINPSRGDGYDPTAQLFNFCESASIQVIAYEDYPCPPEAMIHQGAAPGDIIAAGDDALLSYCPSIER
ncbi:hypothetical protein E4634_06705 [Mangrovimicrobium sediminis]|uniref:PASTA domain-containing protein n=1 Tax=Mangrovimicrobium sediminis TaxID=2562682 RepID=A0A4Z0M644_9GAMM|nr:hypothetical protein [Haliea sp. SAOS-164]TGD74877.1 hypothetical protein E4634_06705 [Haliea sp. SAOS-164]